jgi:hypothetical protein
VPELLRRVGIHAAPPEPIAASVEFDVKPMAPARGILLGCMLGAAMWLLGGLTIWLLV